MIVCERFNIKDHMCIYIYNANTYTYIHFTILFSIDHPEERLYDPPGGSSSREIGIRELSGCFNCLLRRGGEGAEDACRRVTEKGSRREGGERDAW